VACAFACHKDLGGDSLLCLQPPLSQRCLQATTFWISEASAAGFHSKSNHDVGRHSFRTAVFASAPHAVLAGFCPRKRRATTSAPFPLPMAPPPLQPPPAPCIAPFNSTPRCGQSFVPAVVSFSLHLQEHAGAPPHIQPSTTLTVELDYTPPPLPPPPPSHPALQSVC
jgi:hypothetical protein